MVTKGLGFRVLLVDEKVMTTKNSCRALIYPHTRTQEVQVGSTEQPTTDNKKDGKSIEQPTTGNKKDGISIEQLTTDNRQ